MSTSLATSPINYIERFKKDIIMDEVLADGFYFEAEQVAILSEAYNRAITKFVPGKVVDHQTELRLARLILNAGRDRIIAGRELRSDHDARSVASIAFWQLAKTTFH